MSLILKHAVSKNKRRYQKDGFDLDLSYITDRIIAMGFPSEKMEAVFRNPQSEVIRFLDTKHKDHYRVYNLCSERSYDPARFHNRVLCFPFDDHNAPPFDVIHKFCQNVKQYLDEDPKNIVVIHCKAGKGRTGLMICCYLLFSKEWPAPQSALNFYAAMRTYNQKGVTIPSQIRYVYYFGSCMRTGDYISPPEPRTLVVKKVCFYSPPKPLLATTDIKFNIVTAAQQLVFTFKGSGKISGKKNKKEKEKSKDKDPKKDKKADKKDAKDKKDDEKKPDDVPKNGEDKKPEDAPKSGEDKKPEEKKPEDKQPEPTEDKKLAEKKPESPTLDASTNQELADDDEDEDEDEDDDDIPATTSSVANGTSNGVANGTTTTTTTATNGTPAQHNGETVATVPVPIPPSSPAPAPSPSASSPPAQTPFPVPVIAEDELCVSYEVTSKPFLGDIKFDFFENQRFNHDKLFSFWVSTSFITGDKVIITKKELDKIHKDKSCPAEFKVVLHIEDAPAAPSSPAVTSANGSSSPSVKRSHSLVNQSASTS